MAWWAKIRARLGVPTRTLHIAGDLGSGPPVVLVHGIASSSVTFQNLVPLLTPNHRVISIDILGHGGSPSPPKATYRVEEHVEWLERTIRSLRLGEDVVIVGHSLGALIVARYARGNSNRLRGVVLVSPPIYLRPSEIGDRFERAAVNAYLKAYEFLRTHKEFTIARAKIIARLTPIRNVFEISEDGWDAFVLSLQNSIESQTTVSDIAAIRAPVEVVYGALDQFMVASGLRIVKELRHVTVTRVEVNDHIVRRRLARAVEEAIDRMSAADTAPAADAAAPGSEAAQNAALRQIENPDAEVASG